jgi:hypothetical protein
MVAWDQRSGWRVTPTKSAAWAHGHAGAGATALTVAAEDRAVLHHENYIAGRFDIGHRIARHRYDIGQHSGFERAHFVLQAQELGGH